MTLRCARAVRGRQKVRPSYGQGRYGVIPTRVPYIVAISVVQNRLPHHTIGRQHPLRLLPSAVSVEEQGDDHRVSEPSRSVLSLERTFRPAHQGETCAPTSSARVG